VAELVLALDLPTADAALDLLSRCPQVRWVKLGSVLFTSSGPALIRNLKDRGHQVFLDLKWHDIPTTVRGAVSAARRLGVDMVTVHTLGGPAMLRAAKDAAGDHLSVIGVTVLTSHDSASFGEVVGRPDPAIDQEVSRLGQLAAGVGLDGVVCSPLEACRVRAALGPSFVLVTPGIRNKQGDKGDQTRTGTVSESVAAGANYLVVGRPVLAAEDPAAAWLGLTAELAACSR
jgi:orotidine-5'-phosphate decarboxylase